MRILFFGNADFGVPTLGSLLNSSYDLLSVVTNKDKRSGRGKRYSPTPIKEYSLKNNIPIIEIDNLNDLSFEKAVASLEPDICVVIAYRLLPSNIFNIPRYGTINLHASLLPKYRGAAPIQRAILNGDNETGLSTFLIDEKIDTGNLILQEKIKIDEMDSFGEVYIKLSEIGPELMMKTISHILDKAPLKNQEGEVTYAKKITKNETKIIWNMRAIDIHNMIRAFSPNPSAFSCILNKRIKLLKSKIIISREDMLPGQIVLDQGKFFVGTSTCAIEVLELQPEGKRRMKAIEFMNGLSKENSKNLEFGFKE